MESFNPYQPPTAAIIPPLPAAPEATADVWRDGKELVVRYRSQMPARCVKCNAPAVQPMKKRRFTWHHPGYYLLILVGLLLYVIVALIARKSVYLSPGLCQTHALRRQRIIWAAWIAAIGGLVLMFSGGSLGAGAVLLGLVFVLGSLIASTTGARILTASRIDESYARFRGCGNEFLATLPVLTRRR